MMDACPPKTIEHALAAMRDRPDFTEVLETVRVPTLILVGEADAITPPAVAEAMHKAVAGSTLEVVQGAGHLPLVEQPSQVSRAVGRLVGV